MPTLNVCIQIYMNKKTPQNLYNKFNKFCVFLFIYIYIYLYLSIYIYIYI